MHTNSPHPLAGRLWTTHAKAAALIVPTLVAWVFACVSLAYIAQRQGRHYVVLDGVAGPPCDRVLYYNIVFSPDGQRIAYAVQDGQESFLVVDQKVRRDWPSGAWPVFSPDSKRIAYRDGEGYAVVDGVRTAQSSTVTGVWQSVFSTDSHHYAYTFAKSSFIDGQPLTVPNYNVNAIWATWFSPNLKRWACFVTNGVNSQLFLDGKPQMTCNNVGYVRFSPDNRHLAYTCELGTNWWMALDGKVGAPVSRDWSQPYFSPDGERLAYIAGRGPQWWIMVDGRAGPTFIGTTSRGGFRAIFFIGDQQIPALTAPKFSADSKHVTYAFQDGKQWGVMVDNSPTATRYQEVVRGGPTFDEAGNAEFLGIRDGSLYRVSVSQKGSKNSR